MLLMPVPSSQLELADICLKLQFWLLGYEFPATLMLLTPETVYIVTTKKKGTAT